MNKANPTDLANSFVADIKDLADYFDRVAARIAGEPKEKTDTAFSAGCGYPSFRHRGSSRITFPGSRTSFQSIAGIMSTARRCCSTAGAT